MNSLGSRLSVARKKAIASASFFILSVIVIGSAGVGFSNGLVDAGDMELVRGSDYLVSCHYYRDRFLDVVSSVNDPDFRYQLHWNVVAEVVSPGIASCSDNYIRNGTRLE